MGNSICVTRLEDTFSSSFCLQPGLRSRSRGRSWSRSESTVLAGVGVGAGVGKIWSTPTPARSRRLTLDSRRRFWTNGYPSSRKHWKTGRKGEWLQCVDKVKASFGYIIPSEKGIGDNFGVIAIVVWLWQYVQRLSYRPHSKESAITTVGCIRG